MCINMLYNVHKMQVCESLDLLELQQMAIFKTWEKRLKHNYSHSPYKYWRLEKHRDYLQSYRTIIHYKTISKVFSDDGRTYQHRRHHFKGSM